MIKKLFILSVLCVPALSSDEYVYPVASSGQTVYLIHQGPARNLELLEWNPETLHMSKILLSRFMPAGLTLLPDDSGFSFIDNGRIRVKQFERRSPKTIALNAPVYDVNIIHWIDATQFYFSAKCQGRYAIFQATIDGELVPLVKQADVDCMYPQKIDDRLFYIERFQSDDGSALYRVVSIMYPSIDQRSPVDTPEHAEAVVEAIMRGDYGEDILTDVAGDERRIVGEFLNPIIFLSMASKDEAYVIEHAASCSKKDKYIDFSCIRLLNTEKGWQSHRIFNFSLPGGLILPESDSCLYESVFRLLPRKIDGKIYFSDTTREFAGRGMGVYAYCLDSGEIEIVMEPSEIGQQFFPPLSVNDTLYFGGNITQDHDGSSPYMSIGFDGSLCCYMPKISN